jgi:hypothetical protein
MSDQEWERWKTTFQKGGRPVPAVLKRARRARWVPLVGLVFVYVVLAGTMASKVPTLRHATRADIADFVLGLLGSAAIIVAFHTAMRGTFRATVATPLEALAAFERYQAGRLRLMRAIVWIAACACAASLGLTVVTEGFTTRVVELLAEAVTLIVLIVAFVRFLLRPRIDRYLREATEARRLLGEVGDEPSEGKG